MKIWVLQTGEPVHTDSGSPRPMRGMNLANKLVQKGHKVHFWTADFYHQEKTHRFGGAHLEKLNDQLTLQFIPSPGYQRNISPQRFYDHYKMGRAFKSMLDAVSEQDYPDVIFIGYPPIEVAYHLAKWAAARNIPYLLDVKDQWPSYLLESLPSILVPFGRIAFIPYYRMARFIFNEASGFSSMSEAYLNWMLMTAGRNRHSGDLVTPLVSLSRALPSAKEQAAILQDIGVESDHNNRLVFAGTFSKAFDFEPILDMAKSLNKSYPEWEIIFAGVGPEEAKLRQMFSGVSNVKFIGWVQQAALKSLYAHSKGILAPYVQTSNFRDNIPNKVIDAVQQGRPLLCPLDGEVLKLCKEVGLNGHYTDGDSLMAAVVRLCIEGDQDAMQAKLRTVYEARFDFDKVYDRLVFHLEKLATTTR